MLKRNYVTTSCNGTQRRRAAVCTAAAQRWRHLSLPSRAQQEQEVTSETKPIDDVIRNPCPQRWALASATLLTKIPPFELENQP